MNMTRQVKTLYIIIPAYNEETTIPQLLHKSVKSYFEVHLRITIFIDI